MTVDSFKFLPRIIAFYYQQSDRQPILPIPWTPLEKQIRECKFGLVTSGGLYRYGKDLPFDLEREKKEQIWGDPTYRKIPNSVKQEEIGVSHLHINPNDILDDFNILLPLSRFKTLIEDGTIGGIASAAYSFMGFQGFPPDTSAWEMVYGPQVAGFFKAENVDCVLLTPA
jgi:D-proline reductase (dithiol) PrdB